MSVQEIRDDLVSKAAEDDDFRGRLVEDTHAVIEEKYGFEIPEGMNLVVVEDDASTIHLVLPRSSRLTDEELATASGGEFYW